MIIAHLVNLFKLLNIGQVQLLDDQGRGVPRSAKVLVEPLPELGSHRVPGLNL